VDQRGAGGGGGTRQAPHGERIHRQRVERRRFGSVDVIEGGAVHDHLRRGGRNRPGDCIPVGDIQ
jgi:hypothetical protein